MARTDLVYWDSCVFIDRIQITPGRIEALREMTDRAERGELAIATSWLSLCEVAKVRGTDVHAEQERMIVEFFDNEYIIPVQVDEFVAARTRDVIRRAQTRLPAHDAVHIASALVIGAPVLYTYDTDHMLPHHGFDGLRIEEPRPVTGQLTIDDAPGPPG
jgi:predicted nucleic acid-binding protein